MSALSALRDRQPYAVDVFAQALAGGRMHHAYLLVGPAEARGDLVARAVAASLVCVQCNGTDSCKECAPCRKLERGNHPDVHFLGPGDTTTISIEAVRFLEERLALAAAEASHKVAIIEQADLLTLPAQNALLKTLEEPPGTTCFLLTTIRARRLLPTVRSRCQTVRLAPLQRLGAWQALVSAGLPQDLARPLAALVGSDMEQAQALVDLGAADLLASLRGAFASDAGLSDLLAAAAEIGADKGRTELALSLIEIEVRDRLAVEHGASREKLYVDIQSLPTAHVPTDRLDSVARRLAELRRLRAFNVNRTLAVESILMALTGRAQPSAGWRAS